MLSHYPSVSEEETVRCTKTYTLATGNKSSGTRAFAPAATEETWTRELIPRFPVMRGKRTSICYLLANTLRASEANYGSKIGTLLRGRSEFVLLRGVQLIIRRMDTENRAASAYYLDNLDELRYEVLIYRFMDVDSLKNEAVRGYPGGSNTTYEPRRRSSSDQS